jgi:hypothetical protein
MIADAPTRQRGLRSLFTPVRITTAILVGLFCLSLAPLGGNGAWLGGYVLLVVATCIALRSARRAPGSLLGRRAVRRAVVMLIVADCLVLLTVPPPAPRATPSSIFALFLILVVLNIALGGATQRLAAAPDTSVDERQEALRNRTHRIAYVIFAVVVGGTAVVADVASSQTRAWVASSFGGDGLIVFLELLFVLPAMVLAFLEPGYPPLDLRDLKAERTRDRRARLAIALLALTLAIPLILSLAIAVMPVRTSASVHAPTDPFAATSTSCREFFASRTVGVGIDAELSLHAEACWNGKRASETFGMNAGDCMMPSGSVATVVTTTQCTQATTADGTLAFTYISDVSPGLIPFLHRQISLRLVIDRNGNVEQFP